MKTYEEQLYMECPALAKFESRRVARLLTEGPEAVASPPASPPPAGQPPAASPAPQPATTPGGGAQQGGAEDMNDPNVKKMFQQIFQELQQGAAKVRQDTTSLGQDFNNVLGLYKQVMAVHPAFKQVLGPAQQSLVASLKFYQQFYNGFAAYQKLLAQSLQKFGSGQAAQPGAAPPAASTPPSPVQ